MAEETEAPAPDASFSVEMLGVDGKKTKVPLVTEDLRVDLQKVLEAQVFVDWVASVDKDPQLFIAEIEVQSVDMFGPRIGFIKFKSRMDTGRPDMGLVLPPPSSPGCNRRCAVSNP